MNNLRHFSIGLTIFASATCLGTWIDECYVAEFNQFSIGGQVDAFSYVSRSDSSALGYILSGERDIEVVQTTSVPGRPASYGFQRTWIDGDQAMKLSWGGSIHGPNLGQRGFMRLQFDLFADEINNLFFGGRLNYSAGPALLSGDVGGIRLRVDVNSSRTIFGSVILHQNSSEIARVRSALEPEPLTRFVYFPFESDVLATTDCITFEVETFAPSNDHFSVSISQIDTIVPEPTSVVVFGLGSAILVVSARRKSAKKLG